MVKSPWRHSHSCHVEARLIADDHYNRQNPGSQRFVPPGRCFVLLAKNNSALWVTSYPYAEYVRHEWAGAWVNSLFRNIGGYLSSDLIRMAIAHTASYGWDIPDLGIISFVDADKTRPKEHVGRCYREAGFSHVGHTGSGLYAFQLLPEDFPEPLPVPRWHDTLSSYGQTIKGEGYMARTGYKGDIDLSSVKPAEGVTTLRKGVDLTEYVNLLKTSWDGAVDGKGTILEVPLPDAAVSTVKSRLQQAGATLDLGVEVASVPNTESPGSVTLRFRAKTKAVRRVLSDDEKAAKKANGATKKAATSKGLPPVATNA